MSSSDSLTSMLIPRAQLMGTPNPERRLRLLEQVRRRGRERRFSERTIVAYVHWIRRFVVHFGRRHPRELGVEHVREFLSFLTTEQGWLRRRTIRRSPL